MDIISEEKQIEEMTEILQLDACINVGINHCRKMDDCNICKATRIYEAGYRKQSTGEWIWDREHSNYKCSLCGEYDTITPNFCRGCGAHMRGGKNEQHE